MIIDQIGSVFEYKGIVYTIGGKVYANDESIYSGLYGRIAEIRTDADQIEDRDGPEILCEFIPPILPDEIQRLEKTFSEQYGKDLSIEDILINWISMSSEMLNIIDESKGRQTLDIFLIREDWAVDGESGSSTAVTADSHFAAFTFRNMVFQERLDGCIARWNDRQDFEETVTSDTYDAWLHDEYYENHYKVTVDRVQLALPAQIWQELTDAYTAQSRLDDFLSQLAQHEKVSELTEEQYHLLASDPSITARIQAKLDENEAYWNCYWESMAQCTDELLQNLTPNTALEKNTAVKAYRIMVGADGDDFVYADNLPWAEAVRIKDGLSLNPGAYAYIKEVTANA